VYPILIEEQAVTDPSLLDKPNTLPEDEIEELVENEEETKGHLQIRPHVLTQNLPVTNSLPHRSLVV
jgi:hypothetical protein